MSVWGNDFTSAMREKRGFYLRQAIITEYWWMTEKVEKKSIDWDVKIGKKETSEGL